MIGLVKAVAVRGYLVRVRKDYYRLAKLEEYDAIIARNKATFRKYVAKQNGKKLGLWLLTQLWNSQLYNSRIFSSQFAREYLGALLGTSCAIVLFYVILKLTV